MRSRALSRGRAVLLAALCSLAALPAAAQVFPAYLNYQGKLGDASGNPLTGTYSFQFNLYSQATGGTLLFSDANYTGANAVSVSNGIYAVQIGSLTAGGIPPSAFFNSEVWLEIHVNAGASLAGAETLTPRERLATSPYAFLAAYAQHLGSGVAIATFTAGGDLQIPSGVVAATASFTNTAGFAVNASSGVNVAAGGVYAPFFSGTYYGDGSKLTGIGAAAESNTYSSSKTFTNTTGFSVGTSSGVSVAAGGVYAPFFSGTYYGDGSKLTGIATGGETNTFTSSKTFSSDVYLAGTSQLKASSATFTNSAGVAVSASSSVVLGAGGVYAPFFSGTYYGDGSKLTGIASAGETNTFVSSKTFGADVLLSGTGALKASSAAFTNTAGFAVTASSGVNVSAGGVYAPFFSGAYYGDGSKLTGTVEQNTYASSKTYTADLLVAGPAQLKASSASFTNTAGFAIAASSGVNVTAGGVYAPFFSGGTFYGDGSKLTGISAGAETNTFVSSKTFGADVLVAGPAQVRASSATLTYGLSAATGAFTSISGYAITASSGVSVTAGGVYAPFFSGTHYGDGSQLTGILEPNTYSSSKTFTADVLVGGAAQLKASSASFTNTAGFAIAASSGVNVAAGGVYAPFFSGAYYGDGSKLAGTVEQNTYASSKTYTADLLVAGPAQLRASSATFTYGVAASTGAFTNSVTAASVTVTAAGAGVPYALTTSSGLHVMNGKVKLEPGSWVEWPDGTTSTTAVVAAAGGGGGGDAYLAGNQTFSGSDVFSKPVTFSTATLATNSVLGVDAPYLVLRGQAWDTLGGASANRQMFLRMHVTDELNWRMSIDRGGSDLWKLDQSGNMVTTASSTASAFFGDGSNLTGLNANNVTQGTINDARLPSTESARTLTGQLIISGATATVTGQDGFGYSLKLSSGISMAGGTVNAGLFVGNGAGLTNVFATNVAASNVTAGALPATVIASSVAVNAINSATQLASTLSIPDARLSSNVGLLNADQTFTGFNIFNKQVTFSTTTFATNSILGVDAPYLLFKGQAWDTTGTTSATRQMFLRMRVVDENTWKISMDRGGIDLWKLDQAGNVVSVASSTASAFFGDGANLTGLNASNVTQGTLADARLPSTQSARTLTGQLTVTGATATVTGQDASGYSLKLSSGISMPGGTVTAGQFVGNGAGLTNVSATNVSAANVGAGALPSNVIASSIAVASINSATQLASSLTVPDARLSSNVALLAADQTFTGANLLNRQLTLSTPTAATNSILGVDAPPLALRGQAWDTSGGATANRQMFVRMHVTDENNWRISIDRGGSDLWKMDQGGNVVSVASSTASAFFGDGANLTNLNASNLAQGTVSDSRLPSVQSARTLTGQLIVSGATATVTGQDASGYSLKLSSGLSMPGGTVTAGQFVGNGAGLTNVVATGVGTLSSLSVTGAGSFGSVSANTLTTTGSVGVGNASPSSLFTVASDTFSVASTGRVGINTASPSTTLNVKPTQGDTAAIVRVEAANTGASLNPTTAVQFRTSLFGTDGSFGLSQVAGVRTSNGTSDLVFSPGTSGDVATEMVRIASSGNVGIGTSSPANKLHVSSGTIMVDGNAATGLKVYGSTFVVNSNGNVGVGNASPGSQFTVGASTFAVASTGRVGVNGAPSTTLHVFPTQGDSSAIVRVEAVNTGVSQNPTTALQFRTSLFGTDGAYGLSQIAGARTANGTSDLTFSPGSSADAVTERVRMTSGGSVGVGTASPSATVEVSSPTMGGTTSSVLIVSTGAAASQRLVTVLGNGNVGISTATPAATLDIGGTGSIKLPVGTTAQRPASPVAGMLRYNSDTTSVEYYNGAAWDTFQTTIGGIPLATGGNTVTTYVQGNTTYKVHTFTASGNFVVTQAGVVDVLVVAGGGSGGNNNTTNGNGGGGGGGVVYRRNYPVTPQTYAVTVGAGGAAIAFQTIGRGNNGGNSVFDTLTALGGGGGGSTNNTGGIGAGNDGGSGGGSAYGWYNAGNGLQSSSASGGYGNRGAASQRAYTGGGGGGAGGPAPDSMASGEIAPFGDGGRGLGVDITGSLVYYAGGGGGSGNSSERAGDGFDGGGRGAGSTSYNNYLTYPGGTTVIGGNSLLNGLPNTGGGGGGGSYWTTSGNTPNCSNCPSGAGGSGIVIIRYIVAQ